MMPPPQNKMPMGAGGGDEMMAMQDEEAGARKGAIGAGAPVPTKPYTVTVVKGLITQFNETFDALGGADLPNVEWEPEVRGAKWEAPLPSAIYAPLVALKEALAVIGGGQFASKYVIEPEKMVDDAEVRKVTGQLGKMEKDKELIKAMQEPLPQQQPAPQPAGPGPVPSEFGEDDDTLMGGM